MEKKVLSYRLCDLLKYRNINDVFQQNLKPYCYNGKIRNQINLIPYMDQLEKINSNAVGNEMDKIKIFIKTVKLCINTLTKKKYDKCVVQLSELDYSSELNMQILVEELITCGMKCPIAIKGYASHENTDTKPISELCSDMILHFSNTFIGTISFKNELLKVCGKLFLDFVNLVNAMDENNLNNVDNYCGFMTLFGMMYSNKLIPTETLLDFIESIKRTIFNSKIENSKMYLSQTSKYHEKMFGHNQKYDNILYNTIIYYDTETNMSLPLTCYRKLIECTNYHKGYSNLMFFVINSSHDSDFKKFIGNIIFSHQEFMTLNKRFKINNKNPLKPHVVIMHNQLGEDLNKIVDSFDCNIAKYTEVEIK